MPDFDRDAVIQVLESERGRDISPIVRAAARWAVEVTEGDGELWKVPTFEQLGLTPSNPKLTYLDDYDQVWIGARWDIARRGELWDVYRKGNLFASLRSSEAARVVVADGLGSLEVVWEAE